MSASSAAWPVYSSFPVIFGNGACLPVVIPEVGSV